MMLEGGLAGWIGSAVTGVGMVESCALWVLVPALPVT